MTIRVVALAGLLVAAAPVWAQAPTSTPPWAGALTAPRAEPPVAAAPPGGPLDLAFGAFQRGFYLTALTEARKRVDANPNDGPALTLLGVLYRDGLGVAPSPPEAVRWFQRGANAGDRQATFALGVAYLTGEGTAADKTKAKTLFEKAAAGSHPGALYDLGIMAMQADPQDFGTAARDFRQAAQLGDMDAAYSLAVLLRAGQGTPATPTEALDLLKRAADARQIPAEIEYAIALFNGDGIAKDETGAARYFLRAAGQNNPVAQNRIARLLATGRGTPKNMVEAMKWHVLARAAGVPDPWLDAQLTALTPQEKSAVDDAVRKYAGT